MRLRWLLVGVIVVPIAMFAIAWWWLLHTNAGARFLFAEAAIEIAATLEAESIAGDLSSGVELVNVLYRDASIEVRAPRTRFAADLDVFPPSLRIFEASIDGLRLWLDAADTVEAPALDPGDVLSSMQLPVWLFVDDLRLSDARVDGAGIARPIVVQHLYLEGRWRDSVQVDALELETPEVKAKIDGRIDLWLPFRLAADLSLDLRPRLAGDADVVRAAARIRGDLSQVVVNADGDAELEGWRPLRAELAATGSFDSLDVSAFTIRGDDLQAAGRGRVDFGASPRVSADVQVARANVNRLDERWPASYPLNGNLTLDYAPGLLRVDDSSLAIAGTDARLDASADIETASGRVAATLAWRSLQWPIAVPEPEYASSAGDIVLSGTTDDWTVAGRFDLEAGNVDDAAFELTGRGDRERAGFAIGEGRVFGGRLAGDLSVEWVDARAWSAVVDVVDIDTGAVDRDWPGSVSGHFEAQGRARDGWFTASLTGVEGTLRERRFSADGGMTYDRGAFTARALTVAHAGSRVTIDGALLSSTGMRFDVDIDDLGDFIVDGGGGITASGVVSLLDTAPFLRLDAASEQLRWRGLVVSELEIRDRNSAGRGIDLSVLAADLSLDGALIANPAAEIVADRESQAMTFDATYGDIGIALSLDGALDDWRSPRRFDGRLTDLLVDLGDDTTVTLNEPVAMSASREKLTVERLCLSETGGASSCADVNWRPGARIDVAAEISNFPVNAVNRFRDTGFSFDQLVDGQLSWHLVYGERASGEGDVTLTPGRITGGERSAVAVATDTGRVAFNVRNGRLLSATLQLPMPGTGSVDGQFALADVTDIAASDIVGRLNVALDDIAVISVLSTFVDDASGRLAGDIEIAGSVSAPVVSGNLELEDGRVAYLPLGLKLRDIQLNGTMTPDRTFDVEGSFLAGDGRAEIRTRGDYTGRRDGGLSLNIRGESLTLIDVPDVQAVADLDVNVGFRADILELDGRVFIPRARVQPENLPSSRATVSEDVVIVAGRLPDEKPAEPESDIRVTGELEVALGEDAVIDLEVAKASVAGATTFTWSGDRMPIANGRYTLSGDIQAFGQVLTIVEGGVRYPNVPANNPQLRIRAEREIFGNSQVKAAGVLVEGTLIRPTIRAYTQPGTTEERALTLLVTGSDFSYDQGVGAIGFGTYVAPRLFVSYGVGLFDRDNVISARYDLTTGFGIKATSGQRDSGVDITYRIER